MARTIPSRRKNKRTKTLARNLRDSASTYPLNGTAPKPFLKWAGGKGQLLSQMIKWLPPEIQSGKIKRYVEPFVGGGAMYFHMVSNYPTLEYFIFDVNPELILAYQTIKHDVSPLIELLANMERTYKSEEEEEQRKFFKNVRIEFNASLSGIDFKTYKKSAWIERTAQIIFLNKTCYNGLFRVNSKGAFNVPFGNYKNPTICDRRNLHAVSKALEGATIECGDFESCQKYVGADTFVYFDPPYRPISKTASFTSYSQFDFDDKAQKRLAKFYRLLDSFGARLMLSNSDPQNNNPDDRFFERLYRGFTMDRVSATRMINCDATKRGKINELLITNY